MHGLLVMVFSVIALLMQGPSSLEHSESGCMIYFYTLSQFLYINLKVCYANKSDSRSAGDL